MSGTVTFTDGKVYTVAPLGSKLVLDDVSVKVDGIEWTRDLKAPLPPGTTVFGVVRVTLTNTSGADQTVAPTQIWLLDSKNHAFLASAAAAAEVGHPLVGMSIGPGQSATGTLVYPAPGRQNGNLLVYRFGDATDIADATHVGLVRLRLRPGRLVRAGVVRPASRDRRLVWTPAPLRMRLGRSGGRGRRSSRRRRRGSATATPGRRRTVAPVAPDDPGKRRRDHAERGRGHGEQSDHRE